MYDTYVSIDLETTGLNPKRDRIIEIGAIRVEQGEITKEFSTFVNPGRKLEKRITELTGRGVPRVVGIHGRFTIAWTSYFV